MSEQTGIEWTDATWNPLRGCSRVSEGCRHCYAEAVAARFSDEGMPYHGLATRTPSGPRWTGTVRLIEEHLADPLKWRKPRRVFVNSMSDLFHESVPDGWIDSIFAVMALAPDHTFQILTKRAERMQQYLSDPARHRAIVAAMDMPVWLPAGRRFLRVPENWPMPNVWLGVSVEHQQAADQRIPHLLDTPAAVRFLSAEPLLGGLDIGKHRPGARGLHWVIVGGESGHGARPCETWWIRNILGQCRDADVACFVKQLGAVPTAKCGQCGRTVGNVLGGCVDACGPTHAAMIGESQRIRDRKGGDPSEWPEDLRVREFPREAVSA